MRRTRLAVALGSGLLILGLIVWALSTHLEWSEREVWTGYSGEARFNNFLASQRLLERLGQRAASVRGLPTGKRAPGRNDVLLLPSRQARITPWQAASLMAWVKQGGLLVVEGFLPESRDAAITQDPLFQSLGARLVWVPERPSDNVQPGTGSMDLGHFDEANRTVEVRLDGRVLRVRLGAWRELLDLGGHAVRTVRNASGAKLLQYDVGQGRVILCTELACFSNPLIAEEDHAAFLAGMVQGWAPDNKVWIVYRETSPSLWMWLRDRAGRVMAALALLTAAALWHAATRFGPPIPDPVEGRRSLLEHLLACGRFHWARRSDGGLLEAARSAALARVHRGHPGWGHLDFPDFCARLSEASGLSPERIARALQKTSCANPREFTETIQTLEHLRKLP